MTQGSSIPANTNQVKNLLSTSVVSGCTVTVDTVNPTTYTIGVASGVVRFVDNHTDATLPNFSEKVFPGASFEISKTTTKIIIAEDLTVLKLAFTGVDTFEQRRDRIELAVITVAGNVIVTVSNVGFDTSMFVKDAMEAYGPIRISGLKLSPNGSNLSINRSGGACFEAFFRQFFTNTKNPLSDPSVAAITPITFFYSWRDGSGSFNFSTLTPVTTLTPGFYDDGTASTTFPPNGVVNNNEAQIWRVYEADPQFGFLVGQQKYNSIAAAVLAIPTDDLTFKQSFGFLGTSFRGYIVVRGGATDLSLSTDALFFLPNSRLVGAKDQ